MPINNVESYLKKRYDNKKFHECMVRVLAEYIWEKV